MSSRPSAAAMVAMVRAMRVICLSPLVLSLGLLRTQGLIGLGQSCYTGSWSGVRAHNYLSAYSGQCQGVKPH